MKKGSGAGRKTDGNITIDLGEKIDKVVRSASAPGKREGLGKPWLSRPGSSRPGGYRPGMYGFGSFRPWYASAGQKGKFDLGRIMKYPESVSTNNALTGVALGTVANRLLARLVPTVLPMVKSKLATDAINFGLGLIPVLAKPNSMTVGVAIPGLVVLASDLTDWLLDWLKMPVPALSGSLGDPRGGASHAADARARLAEVQARINRTAPQSRPVPRVVAQPAFAG